MNFICKCGELVEVEMRGEEHSDETEIFSVCKCGIEKKIPINSGKDMRKLISDMDRAGIKFSGEEEL